MSDAPRPEALDDNFPPGEFLQDALDNLGWTQVEFAELIGRPPRLINEIIAGKRAITPATAAEIAAALGTSAQYWLNLESAYQLSKAPAADERIAQEAALRQRFPVREMTKRGWAPKTKNLDELQGALFGFFKVNSLDEPLVFSHAARRDYKEDFSIYQLAWLHRVRQLASALHAPKYSVEKLRACVSEMELLMTEPEEIRHVPKMLLAAGVRFVVVEPIPGSKIDGVCFWLENNQSPVIGLSMKGDQIDKFWFNLRHEIEHVLRGDGKDVACVDDFDSETQSQDECEIAANSAAADFCVPAAKMRSFWARHYPAISEQALIGFSRIIKRHPGIVAGQIQKKLNRWDIFKKHQPRVRNIILQTALVDGYGQSPAIGVGDNS